MEVLVFILLEEMGVIVAITQKREMEETGDQDFIPLVIIVGMQNINNLEINMVKNVLILTAALCTMACSNNSELNSSSEKNLLMEKHTEKNKSSDIPQKNINRNGGDGGNGGSGFYSPGADGNKEGCNGGDGGSSFYSPGKKCP